MEMADGLFCTPLLLFFNINEGGFLEKMVRKWIKRFGLTILFLPVILIIAVVAFEWFGMCMNHKATDRQTKNMQTNLVNEISDIEILHVYSETGNISGTGNHVECLSVITFATEMTETEIRDRMSEYYTLDGWECYINKIDDHSFSFYQSTSAPFPNNLEGH